MADESTDKGTTTRGKTQGENRDQAPGTSATTDVTGLVAAQEQGYIGTSPEAERTGAPDKGLSQANPAVMNQGGPVPDARRGVDDADAIKALKG